MKVRIGIIAISFILIILFAIYQYVSYSRNELVVVFCDVGQGDGIYIRSPDGVDILFDAGPDASILGCLSRHMPFWDKKIELIFASHPDADHIGGFKYLLDTYSVGKYNTSEVVKETGLFKLISQKLEEKKISFNYLQQGDTYKIGSGMSVITYWPTQDFLGEGSSNTNRYSLVQMLNFNNFNILLTGDAEFDIVDEIIKSTSKEGIDVEVYKLPHHGSRTGVSHQTFSSLRPDISIISAGKNNRYGHPHLSVLEELQAYNLKFLETKNGDIKITSDGKTFRVAQ